MDNDKDKLLKYEPMIFSLVSGMSLIHLRESTHAGDSKFYGGEVSKFLTQNKRIYFQGVIKAA